MLSVLFLPLLANVSSKLIAVKPVALQTCSASFNVPGEQALARHNEREAMRIAAKQKEAEIKIQQRQIAKEEETKKKDEKRLVQQSKVANNSTPTIKTAEDSPPEMPPRQKSESVTSTNATDGTNTATVQPASPASNAAGLQVAGGCLIIFVGLFALCGGCLYMIPPVSPERQREIRDEALRYEIQDEREAAMRELSRELRKEELRSE